jgi:hypothetical protein
MTRDELEHAVDRVMGLTDPDAVFATADRIAGALRGQPHGVKLYALIVALLEFAERSGNATLASADVVCVAITLIGRLVEMDPPRGPRAVH